MGSFGGAPRGPNLPYLDTYLSPERALGDDPRPAAASLASFPGHGVRVRDYEQIERARHV